MSEISLEYDNPFWLFSTKLYRLEEVEAACIYLQDHQNIMVNQLLFSCWLSTQNMAYDQSWPQQVEPVLGWHNQYVVPVRKQRRQLKPMAATEFHLQKLQEHLLQAELLAEQHEQALLYLLYRMRKGLSATDDRAEALKKNLAFVLKDTTLSMASQEQLIRLIEKILDENLARQLVTELVNEGASEGL